MRANFFKYNKGWRLRVYNASETDIEAKNIRVLFPETDGFIAHWDCEKSQFGALKRHGSFDIIVTLCTSAPDSLEITLEWFQGRKKFTTQEIVQLR